MSEFVEFLYTTILRPKPLRRAANTAILALVPARIRFGPATVYLNPRDPVVSGALTFRVYERDEIAFFRSICRPGAIVLDVGANVGLFTALAMNECPGGCVASIEPHSETLTYLRRTISANVRDGNADCVLFDCAAADKTGSVALFMNAENKADNRLYRAAELASSEVVRERTIDDMLAEAGIGNVDIIKIDVQGGESAALRGAKKTIAASPKLTLLTEFWPDGILQATGEDAEHYLDMLRDFHFDLYELRRGGLHPLTSSWRKRLVGRKYTNLVGMKSAA
jgi:FkbM family methyltransferase